MSCLGTVAATASFADGIYFSTTDRRNPCQRRVRLSGRACFNPHHLSRRPFAASGGRNTTFIQRFCQRPKAHFATRINFGDDLHNVCGPLRCIGTHSGRPKLLSVVFRRNAAIAAQRLPRRFESLQSCFRATAELERVPCCRRRNLPTPSCHRLTDCRE